MKNDSRPGQSWYRLLRVEGRGKGRGKKGGERGKGVNVSIRWMKLVLLAGYR